MKSTLRCFMLVVACIATVAIAAPTHEEEAPQKISNDNNGFEVAHIQRRNSNFNKRANENSCGNLTAKTNDSHPIAHIVGLYKVWRNVHDHSWYSTHWTCNSKNAFVRGGMFFNQTDKTLYVPECGYYYVSSQVLFGYINNVHNRNPIYTRHQLIVQPNCKEGSGSDIRADAFAVKGSGTEWMTTTHTARLFHMCEGGKIQVAIPKEDKQACCAFGKDEGTFFSAHLVRRTDCRE